MKEHYQYLEKKKQFIRTIEKDSPVYAGRIFVEFTEGSSYLRLVVGVAKLYFF